MAGSSSKNDKNPPAPQRSLSRRVSFNESTLKPQDRSFEHVEGIDYDFEQRSRSRRGCGFLCNSCCAWASFMIGVLVLLILLGGGVYFSFMQSNLPDVHLRRLDVNKLNVTNTSNDTLLTADFEVTLNVTNKNSHIDLSYTPMTATLMSEGINLGTMRLPALKQGVQTSSEIKVRTSVDRIPVEEAAASELMSNYNMDNMVITLNLKGHVEFSTNGNRMSGFPFKISCDNIDQTEIDNGQAPKCSSKMSLF